MYTQCTTEQLTFQGFDGPPVVADFNGGEITSDAGTLLLDQAERAVGIVSRFAGCCIDGRNQDQVTHSLETMLAQRIFGICLGYEDIRRPRAAALRSGVSDDLQQGSNSS